MTIVTKDKHAKVKTRIEQDDFFRRAAAELGLVMQGRVKHPRKDGIHFCDPKTRNTYLIQVDHNGNLVRASTPSMKTLYARAQELRHQM